MSRKISYIQDDDVNEHMIDMLPVAEAESMHGGYLYTMTQRITAIQANAQHIEEWYDNDQQQDISMISFAMVNRGIATLYQDSLQSKIEGWCDLMNYAENHKMVLHLESMILSASRQMLDNQEIMKNAEKDKKEHVFIEIFKGLSMNDVLLRQEKEIEIANAEIHNVVLLDMHLGVQVEKGSKPKKIGAHLHSIAIKLGVEKLQEAVVGNSPALRKLFMGRSLQ